MQIPAIQHNYIHSATFGNRSHSAETYLLSRLTCFLVVLNLTPWASEEYLQIPTIIHRPGQSLSMHKSTFLLIGLHHDTRLQKGRRRPKFLRSDKKHRRIKRISGIPALALHATRDKVMWENILRVVYTQTCDFSTTNNSDSGFNVKRFSIVSTECPKGEIMCFRPVRSKLARVSAQKDPRALNNAIRSSYFKYRNRNNSPVTKRPAQLHFSSHLTSQLGFSLSSPV